MPQPNDLSRSLVALDHNSTIIAVVELSQSSWLWPGAGGTGRDLESVGRRLTAFDAVSRRAILLSRNCPFPGDILANRK